MTPEPGRLYQITRNGDTRPLPNLYSFERSEPLHCQLHGEHCGTAWLFRKRRNSAVRPWGTALHRFDSDGIELTPAALHVDGCPTRANPRSACTCDDLETDH